MSGKTYILDTNIIIYLSQERLRISDIATKGDSLCLSIITYMESLGYQFKSKEDEIIVNSLCNSCDIINLTKQITEKPLMFVNSLKSNFQMPLLLQVRW